MTKETIDLIREKIQNYSEYDELYLKLDLLDLLMDYFNFKENLNEY